jgi:hypothetical protein
MRTRTISSVLSILLGRAPFAAVVVLSAHWISSAATVGFLLRAGHPVRPNTRFPPLVSAVPIRAARWCTGRVFLWPSSFQLPLSGLRTNRPPAKTNSGLAGVLGINPTLPSSSCLCVERLMSAGKVGCLLCAQPGDGGLNTWWSVWRNTMQRSQSRDWKRFPTQVATTCLSLLQANLFWRGTCLGDHYAARYTFLLPRAVRPSTPSTGTSEITT